MNKKDFGDKLLTVVLLLMALFVVMTLLPVFLVFIPDDNLRVIISTNSSWIAKIAFGCVMFIISRDKLPAISIGILSVMLPMYGAIFTCSCSQRTNAHGR